MTEKKEYMQITNMVDMYCAQTKQSAHRWRRVVCSASEEKEKDVFSPTMKSEVLE